MAERAQDSSTRRDSLKVPRDTIHRRTLDDVVVTASRRLQRISDIAVLTELISRDDIIRTGAPDLHAVLLHHVGIQTDVSAVGNGGVQIHGLNSERVLVLIDGQPLVGRIDGQLDLSRIPASIVERIEIIKGPHATMYGSAAMGGIINVITRGSRAGRPTVSGTVTGGSRNRFDANASLTGGRPDLHGLLGIGRRQIDVQAGRTEQFGARTRRWDGDVRGTWRLGWLGLTADASLLATIEDQRWHSGPTFFFSDNDQTSAALRLQAMSSSGKHRFTPVLFMSGFKHLARRAAVPEPFSDSGDISRERIWKADMVYSGQFGLDVLDAGIDLKQERLETARIEGERSSLHTVEPYAQYTITRERFSVVPGIRVTHNTQWGTAVTPKLAALYRVTPSVAIRSSIGMGYRAPEFKELYMRFLNSVGGFSYAVVGNPELRPERSTNVGMGAEWTGFRSYARMQGFYTRFTGFIETMLADIDDGIQTYTYQNIESGVTRGVEVQGGVTVRGVTLDGAYDYLDAYQRVSQSGPRAPLLGRAAHSARLSADVVLPGTVRSGLILQTTGRAPMLRDSVTGAVTYRSAFTRADLRAARTMFAGFDLHAGIQNIFDGQPKNWPGITGRQWYVGGTFTQRF